MQSFGFCVPTKIIFGDGSIEKQEKLYREKAYL